MNRWPFRKHKFLGNLIDRTKQVLDDGTGKNRTQKLAALQVLEKQRQVMRVWLSCVCCFAKMILRFTLCMQHPFFAFNIHLLI